MFSCLFKRALRFCTSSQVERPFTPSIWNTMTISSIQSLPEEQRLGSLLHAIRLMQGGITPFDYDFYQWSCWRVVEQQQQLTKQEILMMVRMANTYKITIQPFQHHIENQIYLRIHRDYEADLHQYDQNIAKDMAALMAELEKNSKDYFKLLNETEGEDKEEKIQNQQSQDEEIQVAPRKKKEDSQQAQTQKYIVDMNRKLSKRNKAKQFSQADLVEIMELLQASGSKNLPLLQYILEILTIKYESAGSVPPQEMLQYVQRLTYICQQFMTEYSGNRQRYTPRSVKRIFKFQTLYYNEHLRQLETTCSQLSQGQIQQLLSTYAAFPLKRRQIRRIIGVMLIEEVKKRGLQQNIQFVKALVNINGKDEKMKKTYCQLMGLDLENAKQLGLYQQKMPRLPKIKQTNEKQQNIEEVTKQGQSQMQSEKI